MSKSLLDIDRTAQTTAAAMEAVDGLERCSAELGKCVADAEKEMEGLRVAAKGSAFRGSVMERMDGVRKQTMLATALRDKKRAAKDAGNLDGYQLLVKSANDEKEKLREMYFTFEDYIFQWNLEHRGKN